MESTLWALFGSFRMLRTLSVGTPGAPGDPGCARNFERAGCATQNLTRPLPGRTDPTRPPLAEPRKETDSLFSCTQVPRSRVALIRGSLGSPHRTPSKCSYVFILLLLAFFHFV